MLAVFVGCASRRPTTQPSSARDRQDAAMHDPFAYKPDMSDTDISGGDIGTLDRKAMKKDVNNVLNP